MRTPHTLRSLAKFRREVFFSAIAMAVGLSLLVVTGVGAGWPAWIQWAGVAITLGGLAYELAAVWRHRR